MWRFVLITLLPFVTSCGDSTSGDADGALRYTMRDVNGVRASGSRESVLKTVGMTEEQLKAWASDPAGVAEKRAMGNELVKVGIQAPFTVRKDGASVSSQDKDSASRAIKMEYEQMLEWVKDESAAREGRSVTLDGWGISSIIWRGSSGKVLYTSTHSGNFRTTSHEERGDNGLTLADQDQIRAWVEDENGRQEHRSAGFARNGYMEMISRGTMELPPGLWR